MKIVSEIATGLYDLHTVSLIVSVGSVSESLQLIDMLDEDEGLWIDLKWNLLLNKYRVYDTDISLNAANLVHKLETYSSYIYVVSVFRFGFY